MFNFNSFVERAAEKQINMDAIMVVQNNVILGLHRFSDYIKHNVYSVAKSFNSTAVGMAVDEGLLKLTDKPCDMFAELMDENTDSRWKEVTLYNLLTMQSGHGKPYLIYTERDMLRNSEDKTVSDELKKEWLRYAFTRPFKYHPGEKTSYANLAPYVAGRMVEKAAGCSVNDYLYEKMWKPLGVEKPRWDCDNNGHTFPASDLFLDITHMIKLGQIYLGKGVLDGKRFLSEEWVKLASSNLVPSTTISPREYAVDEEQGYGFLFWRNSIPNSFRAYGREGQFVIVLPDKNAVIATQAMHSDVQEILDLVWECVLPQL